MDRDQGSDSLHIRKEQDKSMNRDEGFYQQWRSQDLVVMEALGWGMGKGASSPENFRILGVKMTCFGAFWHYF